MVLDPVNSAVDRIRLRVADFQDIPILTNDVIQYYITKNNSNEYQAAKECAFIILGTLARNAGYMKIDALISDNKNAYASYKDYLLKLTTDPRTSLSVPKSYFGGISKADMLLNNANADNNLTPSFSTTPQPDLEWLRF